jgi:hypothetical protein
MPSPKRSFLGRVYRAYKAFFEPLYRGILPLSNNGMIVKPHQSCLITGRVQTDGFWPDRLTISSAGTKGGAADWIVNDIRIAGRSQFIQSGDIPGDVFATEAVNSLLKFEVAKAAMDVEIIVTYIGENEKGCAFYASIAGTEYDPGLLDIVRDAFLRSRRRLVS